MDECKYIRGGVYLVHSLVKGKHQYEVENFITCESHCIVRKRDKVLMINNVETQDLPPELFAKMLKYSPMLTWHAVSTDEEGPNIPECQDSDTFQIFTKEKAELSFSFAMVREDCLTKEEEEASLVAEGDSEGSDLEDDSYLESNMLMVSMTNVRMEVVTGRGFEADHICNNCKAGGCSISRMVVTAKHCEVTSECSKYINKYLEKGQCIIQSLLNTPITSRTVKRTLCRSYSTSEITIYYYQTNIEEHLQPPFSGVPVVLNFTSTSNFLKCIKDEKRPEEPVMLTVECCEKKNLQRICKDDPALWPFVFYMTNSKGESRRFESAAHRGWFIHTINTNTVCMGKTTNKSLSEDSFYFIIFRKDEKSF
ncbi:uncharacterized protein LOC143528416 [Brachyhypopomus gauderio]|uniref:uncharacterized protein LOC143528416 n=1 Tax=Brachyhypopomus gauderio TaxID=698409 RepID=UPI004042E79B